MSDNLPATRCPSIASACECQLPAGHPGAHRCDERVCGGMWIGDDHNGTMHAVRMPITGFVVPGMERYVDAIDVEASS